MIFNINPFQGNDFGAQAALPPPSDGVNGIQNITGDWLVNSTEIYTNEIINLRGNLTIDAGGVLTFKNVTLMMNITNSNQDYKIIVNDGGRFNILDNDSDPATMSDQSVITDGILDSDNMEASADFRYLFKVFEGGEVNISNSRLEEIGTKYYTSNEEKGLYGKKAKLTIRNSTFTKCYWTLWLEDNYDDNNRSISVDNVTIATCHYGIYLYSINKVEIKNSTISNYNYYGIFAEKVSKLYVFNSTLYNQITSDYSFYIKDSSYVYISGCTINKSRRDGVYLTNSNHIWIQNSTFREINSVGINNRANYNSYHYFMYNRFYQSYSGGIYSEYSDHTRAVGNLIDGAYYQAIYFRYCDYSVIDKNTIKNLMDWVGVYFERGSYLKFRNNTMDLTNYWGFDYPVYFYYSDNLVIENNTFKNLYDYGIYCYQSHNTVWKDNLFEAGSWTYSGIEISRSSNIVMINNTFKDFYYGIGFSDANYYSSEPVKIYGGSISGSTSYDMYLYGNSKVNTYNLSFDPGKIYISSATGTPTVNVFYPVDVYVHDSLGPLGGAEVTAKSKSQTYESTVYTDNNGRLELWVLNGTYKYNSITLYRPYNISANVSGTYGYANQEYDVNSYLNIDIFFNYDTKPSAPVNFFYRINHSSVDLFWECYVNDLKSYKIYRQNKTGGSWQEIGYITNPNSSINKKWTDFANGTDLIEYNYKIHHIDNSSQEGANANSILYDDWLYVDMQSYTDKNLVINGSLIIENGGELRLDNVSITMNESDPVDGDNIEVFPGGKLYIIDDHDIKNIDENTTTTLNCIPSTPDDNYGIKVHKNGFLEIRNSYIKNASTNIPSISRNSNILVDGGDLRLFNSTIISMDYGLYFEDAEGGQVYGNVFENNKINRYNRGVHMINSRNLSFAKNSFNRSLELEIYGKDLDNVSINGNSFISENKSAIQLTESNGLDISDNYFEKPIMGMDLTYITNTSIFNNEVTNFISYGIDLRYSDNITINKGTFRDAPLGDKGIYLHDTEGCTVDNNTIYKIGTSHQGIHCYIYKDLTISSNAISDVYQGIYLQNIYTKNEIGTVKIYNNTVHHTGTLGYGMYLYTIKGDIISGNTIYKSFYGINMYDSWDLNYEDNTVYNCTYGYRQDRGERNLYFENENWGCHFTYFFLNSAKARIYNSTITGTPPFTVYVNTSSDVVLTNPFFDLNKLYVSDKTSRIEIQWTFDIQVFDQFGIPQKDISVGIRNIYGTKLYDLSTDQNGKCYFILLTTRIQFYASNLTYNPHTVEAMLGNHTGTELASITSTSTFSMWLDNKAPSAYNVIIAPFRPLTKQSLNINYVFSDPEFDIDKGSKIKWYRNGVYQPGLDNKTSVEGAYTQKGDFWFCKVTPFDGVDFGSESTSTYAWVVNTKPTVTTLELLPEVPDSTQDLRVNYTYSDDDGDLELGTIFKWYVWTGGDFILKETTSVPELNLSWTGKGEKWKVTIEPRDGEAFGDPVASNNVTIGNSPPMIANASLVPSIPLSSDDLTVMYDFIDTDNDLEMGTKFQWYRLGAGNVTYNTTGEQNRTVPAVKIQKGERWMCDIQPHDGNNYGIVYSSPDVVIENTPPALSQISIQPSSPLTGDELSVDANQNYFDSDSDPPSDHSYEWLRWSETGGVYLRTGLKLERLPSIFTLKDEIWICEVTPFDGFTYGEPVRTDPVEIDNSPPKASSLSISPDTPTTGNKLYANYVYLDDNNDPENGTVILWYKDGRRQLDLDNEFFIDSSLTSRA
jgi:parallel beta-helix repeat protein